MRKEILTINEKEKSIKVIGNQINSTKQKDVTKKGCQIFEDGHISSSSYVGQISDQDLEAQALRNRDGMLSYDYTLPTVHSKEFIQETMSNDKHSEFMDNFRRAFAYMKEHHKNFVFNGSASLKSFTKHIDFKDEASLKSSFNQTSWYFTYVHKSSASIMDGYFGHDGITLPNIFEQCQNYSRFLTAFENKGHLTSQKMPVIFTSSQPLIRKFLESAKASAYYKGACLYKNKLGEKIFNEQVTLQDISFDLKKEACRPFDSEGHIRTNPHLNLIENGVFKNVICDLRDAYQYDVAPTGNGHRSFNSNTTTGFNTISLLNGDKKSWDIAREHPQCLLVEMAAGGDFTDEGHFSSPVQNSYVLEYGEVVAKAPQVTLTSSVDQMFGDDLIAVAQDSIHAMGREPSLFINMQVEVQGHL